MSEQMPVSIILSGLQSGNPLAFLASLGVLRGVTLSRPELSPILAWAQEDGNFRPVLRTCQKLSPDELVAILRDACRHGTDQPEAAGVSQIESELRSVRHSLTTERARINAEVNGAGLKGRQKKAELSRRFAAELDSLCRQEEDCLKALFGAKRQTLPSAFLADDLDIAVGPYHNAVISARRVAKPGRRADADFLAAFGFDLPGVEDSIKKTNTDLRMLLGSGHQFFLLFLRNILGLTEQEAPAVEDLHIAKSLFEAWSYDDPVKSLTMRWDPKDLAEGAKLWRDPSGDPDRQVRGSMLGANALALLGLPLLPMMPISAGISTTGFRREARRVYWTWPIWDSPISMDSVRSLLSLPELQRRPIDQRRLKDQGIIRVHQSERITVGKFRNFADSAVVV